MEYLLEYYQYLVVATALSLLIIGFYTLVSVNKIKKYFSNKRFRISSNFEINPVDLSENFTISVFNNNVNDARVVAIGFNYKNRNIDYFTTYLQQNNFGGDSKIIIASRDSIRLIVKCDLIKKIIRDLNNGRRRTKNIDAYVIDSLGITTTTKTGSIRKNLVRMFKQDIKKEKQTKRFAQKTIKEEKRKGNKEARLIRKSKRREKLSNMYLKLKSKFRK